MRNPISFKPGHGIKQIVHIALMFLLISWTVAAQETVINYTDALNDPGFVLQSEDQSGVNITFSIDKFTFTDRVINGDNLKTIQLPGNFLPNNFGAPDLPGNGKYIAVPVGATATLTVKSLRTESFANVDMASAPKIPKVTDTGPLDYQKDMSIYSKNAFYPVKPVSLSAPMKIRGVDVVMLGITPFQYNPVTKELIVYRDIEVEVNFNGGNGHFGEDRLRSRWWDPILKDALFNSAALPKIQNNSKAAKSDSTDLEYIIITPDDAAFVQWADTIRIWRTRQGIRTGVVTISDIGGNTTTLIENYINHAYNNWTIPPSAILFLGDYGTTGNDCIISPVYNNYCISDNIYADVDGDHLPDISTARITARNAAELEHMIGKFLSYERNPPVNPGFYDNPVTAMGWQTERWFQLCSEIINGFWEYGLGKNPVRENAIYSGTPGTVWSTNTNTQIIVDYFGTYGLGYIPDTTAHLTDWGGDATRINHDINNGAFMLQHRDHGSVTGWGEPNYSISDMTGLVNNDLTYVFSINCLTGKFNSSSECFAEAFHRHQYGVLGIMAATEVSYSFVNDTYVWGLYDNMWPEFMPAYGAPPGHSDNILPAFANTAAKHFLQQSSWPYNPQNKEVTYYLFHHHGDAFSTVYSEIPQYLTVVHDPILYSGVNFFTVTADTGALIALTVNDEIIGVDYGTGGALNIPIIAQMPGNQMLVTVTKQNYYRYTQTIPIIPPAGPFVAYLYHTIDDTAGGNANAMVEFGEIIDLSIAMLNLGIQMATNVNVTISTSDTNVYIIDSTEIYGNINPNDTVFILDGFSFGVNDLIPDNHNVLFNVEAVGDSTWNSTFTETIFAPVLEITNMIVSDPAGNINGRLDPGETADIIISTKNTGHSDALNTVGNLLSTHPDITVNTTVYNLNTIAAGNSVDAIFNITVDPLSSIGTVVDLDYSVNSVPYNDQKTFYPSIGLIVEDWESGGFNTFNWNSAGNAPWTIDVINPYEGIYCARSGIIGHSSSSVLYVTSQVMADDSISFFRKVSSESGYDYLRFYIDNVLQDQWAGELPWTRVSYPVSIGLHTFKWEYMKDSYASSGEDCAWLDFIEFPPINIPSLDAGVCKIYDLPGQSAFHDIRVDIINFGLDSLISATIDWEVDGVPGSSYYWTGNLPKDGIDGPVTLGNYNFTNGWHNIRAWTTIPNGGVDGFNFNDTLEIDAYFISPISTFPYCESFENGPGMWQQPINDDFDWTRNSGTTQSGSTGPSGAYDGTYYMYTESSNPRVDGDEAFFDAEFDFNSLSSPELTFHYHMYGNGMGTLYVDVFDSVWHMGVWSLSGNQGNTWFQAVVNLSAYANKANIAIRLRGEVGNGSGSTYRSDMAIDLVCVHELVPIYCIPYSGCTNGDGIEDFVLNTITHMGSGCSPGGFGDFTNMQTNLVPGGSYSMSVSSNYANQYVSLWIDMDANYNFDNSERLISDFPLPSAGPLYTDNLIIPASAASGLYRMRVRARWDATSINPCDTFTYGETHDYMVMIIPDTTLIVYTSPDTSICEGDYANVNVNVIGSGTPFIYLWSNGSTLPSMILNPVVTTTYTVTVTDSYGNSATDDVVVSVSPLPQINLQPVNTSVNQGGNTTFSVQVIGAVSYQWQYSHNNGNSWVDVTNNSTYSGVYTNVLTITNALLNMDTYLYRCVITNSDSCFVISDEALLTVILIPTIVTEAVSHTGCLGNLIVPVTATNFNNVASISLTMDYDTTHLLWVGYQNLHPALAGGTIIVNASGGKIIITWFDLINVSFGDNTILELIFTSVGGTSTLNWDILTPGACQYSDISAYVFPSSFIDGVINTFSCSSIAGEFTYINQDSTPLTNTQLYAYNLSGYVQDSTISGSSGDYNFPYLPLGYYSIMANINKVWGGVNASDALMIMMHFAGMTNLSGLNLEVADVDVSGYVNTLDALMCAQRFVGMINSFPSGDWAHDIDTLLINGTAPVIYNFNGLCFGDVNSNYTPPTIKAEPLLSLETKGILEVMSNEDIVIPLSVNKDMDINAISLILNYPTQLFKFKKLELMAKHGVLQYKEINGEIRISWYSTNSLEIKESEALLYLSLSPITFDYSKLNKSIFAIQGISELADKNAKTIPSAKLVMPELVSVSELKGGFYLGQNYPNPYNDYTEIEYTLVESGKVNLEVFNTLGEKIDIIINDEMHNAGSHKAKINASQLSPGMYYYRMNVESKSGSTSKTRTMIIIAD